MIDVNSLISAFVGSGLVLFLAQFVFNRLIAQVDNLAQTIAKLDNRVVRLETLMKIDQE